MRAPPIVNKVSTSLYELSTSKAPSGHSSYRNMPSANIVHKITPRNEGFSPIPHNAHKIKISRKTTEEHTIEEVEGEMSDKDDIESQEEEENDDSDGS